MKVIITEDIINKAINESVNEFILQEAGGLNNLKTSMLGKAWNGVKNAAAMYMNWRTGGKWNRDFGIYAQGSGRFVMLNYFSQWLKKNRDYLSNITTDYNSIEGKKNDPIDYYRKNFRQTKHKGDPRFDPEAYIAYICTPNKFFQWVRQYNKISPSEKDGYLTEYISERIWQGGKNISVPTAMKYLNIDEFYNDEIGKKYLSASQSERNNQLEKIKQQKLARLQPALNARRQKMLQQQNQQQQQPTQQPTPTPDKKDGTFTIPNPAYPYNGQNINYKGWVYSYDNNTGKKIVINPNNPKQAAFI